jgi:bifunctional non-homologous end joining protein LigD
LQYCDHQIGRGPEFHKQACAMALEGIVSKRADAPYAPGNRGLWLKVKCLHREEFVVVGWTDPEGARPWLGSLLLAYYDPVGRLVWSTPGAPASASTTRSSDGCGAGCSRSQPPKCR